MRSSGNVISKNAADIGISATAFLAFGWMLSTAPGGPVTAVIGFDVNSLFAASLEGNEYPLWVFGFAFAATSTTIISGSVAERLVFKAYLWVAFVSTGLAYPLVARWVWYEDGFLAQLGMHDLAGCSAVHMVGGIQGLVGTIMLGPRIGVFTGSGADRRYWPTRSSATNVLFGTVRAGRGVEIATQINSSFSDTGDCQYCAQSCNTSFDRQFQFNLAVSAASRMACL